MLTVHVTHSPPAYDRSTIPVDCSLRLPPRSKLQVEEEEDEAEEEETYPPSENMRSDSTCFHSSLPQNRLDFMGGSYSASDRF